MWTLLKLRDWITKAIDTWSITGEELFAFYTDSDYTWRAPLTMEWAPVPWRLYEHKWRQLFQEFDNNTNAIAFNTHTRSLWLLDPDNEDWKDERRIAKLEQEHALHEEYDYWPDLYYK